MHYHINRRGQNAVSLQQKKKKKAEHIINESRTSNDDISGFVISKDRVKWETWEAIRLKLSKRTHT